MPDSLVIDDSKATCSTLGIVAPGRDDLNG